jgi:hypothetical protein
MLQETDVLKKGRFYFIYDGDSENFVIEDRTKRGLPVIEYAIDTSVGVMAEKGRFYDANGSGHVISTRWYFPKLNYTLVQVCKFADALDGTLYGNNEGNLSGLLIKRSKIYNLFGGK